MEASQMIGPTREQVIQWARESGDDVDHTLPSDIDFLERFASVAYAAGQAAEREACANLCVDRSNSIVDKNRMVSSVVATAECAAAIRARGKA